MQFKNPEILYFLTLLIIPVLIHLFQLQRYIKTPFTNVAFLQKIVTETRHSSRIKKWIILTLRLLFLSALVLAFSQPYFSDKKTNKKELVFIYLDNSLSTNTNGKKGNLLQTASQEIIENISSKNRYSLLTNTNFYHDISSSELKKALLKIKKTATSLTLNEILLKINSLKKIKTKTLNKNILISDFQFFNKYNFTNVNNAFSLIKLKETQKNNLFIDSVFVNKKSPTNFNINVIIKNDGNTKKDIPIAIYNNEKLISKQTFSVEKNQTKTILFPIQKTNTFLGKIQITFSDTFSFDNSFYFTLSPTEKINILAIGNNNKFLSKIYKKNEFNLTYSNLKNVNYNSIKKQQLIILNEIKKLPETLIITLSKFSKNGGNLMIIPNEKSNIDSYNLFLKKLNAGRINSQNTDTLKITSINFSHPILKNVFSKKISNFQYPFSQNNFDSSFLNESNIISLENNKGFIKQINLANSKLFWFSSALNKSNSNFTNSPLIVPVFYNIGQQSFHFSKLYYRINETNKININTQINEDEVLKITNKTNSFIPIQKKHPNKITLSTKELPDSEGFYFISQKLDTLKTIAFNNPKNESLLQFLNTEEIAKKHKNITNANSVAETLQKINQKNKIHWLWQWFLALAIVFLLLEILFLKYYKV